MCFKVLTFTSVGPKAQEMTALHNRHLSKQLILFLLVSVNQSLDDSLQNAFLKTVNTQSLGF